MGRSDYFQALKALARETRDHYHVATDGFGLREMRAIYKAEHIRIDPWPYRLKKVRAAYFVVDGESSVILNHAMKPVAPRLFSMAHELKHHFTDREIASKNPLGCQGEFAYDSAPDIEVGAEVFAAEFIFPEQEFLEWATERVRRRPCTAEDVVELKRSCPARVSYTFLVKRLERLGLCRRGSLAGVKFVKLEEQLHGIPFYRRLHPRAHRGRA